MEKNMINIKNKFFTVVAGCLMISGSAFAQTSGDYSSFQSTFSYKSDAPVEVIYKTIKKQTKKSCKNQMRHERMIAVRIEQMKLCQATMLSSAVDQINNLELIKLHAERTGKIEVSHYAKNKRSTLRLNKN